MSNKAHFEPMSYGIEKTVEKLQLAVSDYQSDLEEISEIVLTQQKDLQPMRTQLKRAQAEIASTRRELTDVTKNIRDQCDSARRKAHKIQERLEGAYDDAAHYEDMLLSESDDLSELIDHLKNLKKEVNTLYCSDVTLSSDVCQGKANFSFQTKDGGKVYTTALYYAPLANQLPPAIISSIILALVTS